MLIILLSILIVVAFIIFFNQYTGLNDLQFLSHIFIFYCNFSLSGSFSLLLYLKKTLQHFFFIYNSFSIWVLSVFACLRHYFLSALWLLLPCQRWHLLSNCWSRNPEVQAQVVFLCFGCVGFFFFFASKEWSCEVSKPCTFTKLWLIACVGSHSSAHL